ncbi:hypothetical protein SAMN04487910_1102 [Aquimarina amphilecti]|uniref:Uncharacterized protein n=1 Tax=Aquimarina amphilecti TaxID=1038014 RepID=A0A1H7JTS2_AQUAM|nr:hypothetical protein [Aquimarina amphilecti]SEK78121.1 hypothetical protein SAMN04487910_1102 [Aquimarina amphilecti]
MTQEKTNNIEIDLGQFFKSIIKGLKGLLKLLIKALLFYKKKWVLFLILLVLGAVGGYFIEKTLVLNKRHKQEIILAPKYSTIPYIYDFVKNLNIKFKDKLFLKEIDLHSSDLKYLKKVTIEPIIESKDVIDKLQIIYPGQNYFNKFMEGYENEALKSGKYKSFYKNHKLTLVFKNENKNNTKISRQLLSFISKNEYYIKELSLIQKQTKSNLEKNKKTLIFIEDYLDRLNKNPISESKDVIVLGDESKIPTIASLIDKKAFLLGTINDQEKTLELDTNLVDVIDYGNIVRDALGIHKRLIVLLPVFLCFFVSFVFLIKNSSKKLENFINN